MNLPASLEGRDRVRLFCAFPLPEDVVDVVTDWQAGLGDVEARLVRREDLHITLAFLGHRPSEDLERVVAVLDECATGAVPPQFSLRKYRETPRVGMLAFEDGRNGSAHGRAFADDLQRRLEEAGLYVRERRPWTPHVTVMRFKQAPRLRPELPEIPALTPSDAAVYLSVLRSTGAQYEIIHRVALGR